MPKGSETGTEFPLEIEQRKRNSFASRIVDNKYFEGLIAATILVNCLFMAMTDPTKVI